MNKYILKNNIDDKLIYYKSIKNKFIIFKNLWEQLYTTKNKIDYFKHWEYYKRKGNKYENIYTSNRNNICKKNPISRSYFKLCEILKDCDLFYKYKNILCMAEAPGGFIQYISEMSLSDNIYGNTLISTSNKVPSWNYKILNKYKIKYTHNLSNDGDLTNINIINNIHNTIQKCDLITADGGIDTTGDYNNQERYSFELIYAEIYLTLICLKEGGSFILKIFDIFYLNTIQLLYILGLCFEEIIFIKPKTSRSSNSEKYIVCKKYKTNKDIIASMLEFWDHKLNLNIKVSNHFIHDLFKYNETFVKNQISNINYILNFNERNNNNNNNYKNKLKCIEWCKHYNMPINIHA